MDRYGPLPEHVPRLLHGMRVPSASPSPLMRPSAALLSAAALAQYKAARLGIAVASAPAGPYVYQHSFRPHGAESRDFTVFQARMRDRALRRM